MIDEKYHLGYTAYIKKNNKMYFSNTEFNGLFEINVKDYIVKYLKKFPVSESDSFSTHAWLHWLTVLENENEIIFFPNQYDRIFIFDTNTNEEKTIILPEYEGKCYETAGAFKRHNMIWIIPLFLDHSVFIWDLERNIITEDRNLYLFQKEHKRITNIVEYNDNILFGMEGTNHLIICNLDNFVMQEYTLPIADLHMYSICTNNRKVWFTQTDSTEICEWEPESGTTRIYKCEYETEDLYVPFLVPVYVNEKDALFIPGVNIPYIMKLDFKDGIVKKAFEIPEDFCFANNIAGEFFSSLEIVDDEMWCHTIHSNSILKYNLNSGKVSVERFLIDEDELFSAIANIVKPYMYKNKVIVESSDLFTLKSFIKNVEYNKNYLIDEDKFIGSVIYSHLK